MPAAVTAHHTFTFGESRSCSQMTRGFSVPQKMVLCQLMCPLVWKVASSLNATRLCEKWLHHWMPPDSQCLIGYSSFWLKSGCIPHEHAFALLSKRGRLGCGMVASQGLVSRFATLFFVESLFPNLPCGRFQWTLRYGLLYNSHVQVTSTYSEPSRISSVVVRYRSSLDRLCVDTINH
jgi:hypothetical protein